MGKVYLKARDGIKMDMGIPKGDRFGMGRVLEETPRYLMEAARELMEMGQIPEPKRIPGNVILAGLGGSAICGDLLINWLGEGARSPISISRNYFLPRYANEDSLVVAVSYSGNTAETIKQFLDAKRAGCQVAAISSGGKLEEICKSTGSPFLRVRAGFQPRAALPFMILSLAHLLKSYGVVEFSWREVESASSLLEALRRSIGIEAPDDRNEAKGLSKRLLGKFVSVYSAERMSGVARRFKDQLNENAKTPSKFETLPEALHNDVEAPWPNEDSAAVLIRRRNEEREERILLDQLRDLLEEGGGFVGEIRGIGDGLGSILSCVYFSDYVSYYLAIEKGVDPTPVEKIERLKALLRERGYLA
ncbi:MAG: bifunctional phosphoglucose/phosphomannose isomerase [Candidatus Bathyarchaeia archaeon]